MIYLPRTKEAESKGEREIVRVEASPLATKDDAMQSRMPSERAKKRKRARHSQVLVVGGSFLLVAVSSSGSPPSS